MNELEAKKLEDEKKVLHDELDKFTMLGKHVPAGLHGGIVRYITEGTPMGHFLTAVACNDLGECMSHGDLSSLEGLHATYCFFYNVAPSECWGSKVKVKAWVEKKAKERQNG